MNLFEIFIEICKYLHQTNDNNLRFLPLLAVYVTVNASPYKCILQMKKPLQYIWARLNNN